MKQKTFLALGILVIILVSGCIGEKTATGKNEADTKVPPSLNAYGKLINISNTDELTIFKIQSEIINLKLNNTVLEINVNKTLFEKEYKREIIDYSRKSYDYDENNVALSRQYSLSNYYIYNIYNLEPETFYYFTYENIGENYTYGQFGQFVSYDKDKELLNVYSIFNNAEELRELNLNLTDSRPNRPTIKRFISAQRPWRITDLSVGNNYVFYFYKLSEKEGSWDRLIISKNLTEYKQNGAIYHENNLAMNQMTVTEGGEEELEPGQQRTVKIIPTAIIVGKPTELKISLINKQSNEIRYKIKDAKIVNEQASQWYGYWWQLPPYEERLKNAIIDGCAVSFNPSESIISSNSTKTLIFTANCPIGIDITKSYEICDNYKERINCRTETASRTDNLMLWGKIEYIDELGNVHTFPEKGVLKQSLEIRN